MYKGHLINLKQSFVLCLSAVGHPITFLNMYSVLKKTVRMTLDACGRQQCDTDALRNATVTRDGRLTQNEGSASRVATLDLVVSVLFVAS